MIKCLRMTVSVANRLQWTQLCVQIHLGVRSVAGETFMAICNVGNETRRFLMGRVKTSPRSPSGRFHLRNVTFWSKWDILVNFFLDNFVESETVLKRFPEI